MTTMFFSEAQVSLLGKSWATEMKVVAERLCERIATILEPSTSRNFNFVFMPAAGFPEIHGFRLKAGETYAAPFSDIATDAAMVEFWPEWSRPWRMRVALDNCEILIESDSRGGADVFCDRSQLAKLPRFDLGTVSFRTFNGEAYLNLNSKRMMPLGVCTELRASRISVSMEQGEASLIQVQALHTCKLQHLHFQNCEHARRHVIASASPRWVLLWERQSKFFFHTAMMCAQVRQILLAHKSIVQDASFVLNRIDRFQRVALNCLMAWPFWRPAAAQFPENGPWERNSWANGYFPGALGVLAALNRESSIEDVEDKFDRCGTRWITHLHRIPGPFELRFPDHRHWIGRSTNHGLVIYASFLIGAFLIRPESNDADKAVEGEFLATLRAVLSDGCYLEGLTYLQFVLLELLPYAWIHWRQSGYSWKRFMARRFPQLDNVKRMMWHASRADGAAFATFGDCELREWIPTAVRFADAAGSDEISLSSLLDHASSMGEPGDEYLPMALCLPTPASGDEALFTTTQTTLYPDAGMAAVRGYDESSAAWSLWICGSRVHLTHNKDYDCGTFFLEIGAREWIGEFAGHAASAHNGWIIEGSHLQDEKDSLSAYGESDGGGLRTRSASGSVGELTGVANGYRGLEVTSPPLYAVGDSALIRRARRTFFFSESGGLVLLIIDRLDVAEETEPLAQFLSPTVDQDTVSVAADGTRVVYEGLGILLQPKGGIFSIVPQEQGVRVLQRVRPSGSGRAVIGRIFVADGVDGEYRLEEAGEAVPVWRVLRNGTAILAIVGGWDEELRMEVPEGVGRAAQETAKYLARS